jgi:RNA polymerase sigma factor (TIGR02999 family)
MSEVTRLLVAAQAGDAHAANELLPLVYDELRTLAAAKMAREMPGQTLNATALVHEAYVRLVDSSRERERPETPVVHAPGSNRFANRRHFFAAAAEAMRRILVDRARERKSLKRGGDRQRLDLDQIDLEAERTPDDVLALHEALAKLEATDKAKADLVTLRFFAGMTNEQAALALDISPSTADNYWAYARAWLRLEIEKN